MPRRWLSVATPADASALAALRNAAADDLTARHGPGWWSGHCTERGPLLDMRHGRVYLRRQGDRIVATATLLTKKPWAIDRAYFTPVKRPLYLVNLAVAPDRQRRGLGRSCLEAVTELAREWPADAILLDAFDHPAAGAGPFYAKCGYRETGRTRYRETRLVYYEMLLPERRAPAALIFRGPAG